MKARAFSAVAIGTVAAAAAAGIAVWHTKREVPEVAMSTASPSAANVDAAEETLESSGPRLLVLKVVNYHGLQGLGTGKDTTNTTYDVARVFAPYNLNIRVVPDGPRAYPFSATEHVTRSQLDSLATEAQGTGGDWNLTVFMLDRGVSPGDRGLLLKETKGRNQVAVFTNGSTNSGRVLRTAAHEIGHALNLFHSDGDGTEPCCASTGRGNGTSLMNQDRCLDKSNWLFTLSDRERTHLLKHPLSHIKPGTTVPYGECALQTHTWRC